ncbi:AI-2E family transporter [Candidatus Sumerlaeota bacterium]|nr:AI-2E family transporter [Candidatus Sumerlaeota bacterium]
MEQKPLTNDPYITALRAVFWVFCFGVFTFVAVQAWPVLTRVLDVLSPFTTGLILAYVLHPIVRFAEVRLKMSRDMGILVVAALIVGIITLCLVILVPILYAQISASVSATSDFFTKGTVIDKLFGSLSDEDRQHMKDAIQEFMARLRERFQVILTEQSNVLEPVAAGSFEAARRTVHVAVSAFGWLGGFIATTALTSIVTVWYLAEMSKIPSVIRRLLPERNREQIWDILLKANQGVGGFLRGQLLACVGVGILTTILMLFAGPAKYAILIGFLAGAVNFIPYLGPTIGAAPALLWALLSPQFETWGESGLHIALILGGCGLIQAIDGFVFQPLIVGPQASLHPLAVMLALVVGAQFGIGGMILAVPLASAIKVVFVEVYWKKTKDFLDVPPQDSGTTTPPSNAS